MVGITCLSVPCATYSALFATCCLRNIFSRLSVIFSQSAAALADEGPPPAGPPPPPPAGPPGPPGPPADPPGPPAGPHPPAPAAANGRHVYAELHPYTTCVQVSRLQHFPSSCPAAPPILPPRPPPPSPPPYAGRRGRYRGRYRGRRAGRGRRRGDPRGHATTVSLIVDKHCNNWVTIKCLSCRLQTAKLL